MDCGFDYLTGMPYLLVLPSLVCGIALGVEDLRSRSVPRLWVAVGSVSQCMVYVVYGAVTGRPTLPAVALIFAVLAASLQLALSRIRPGSLGLGDVTSSFLTGQAVGAFGFEAFAVWWLTMGAIGLVWVLLWQCLVQRRSRRADNVPFVPAIVGAGVIAIGLL